MLPLIDENFVVDRVAEFLTTHGFVIEQRLSTNQTGVDIRATHPQRHEAWLVEAKGQTSSKKASRRHGKAFNSSQISVHVGMAVYAALALRQRNPDENSIHIGLALPDDEAHKRRIAGISRALDLSGIQILWVMPDGQVKLASAGVE